ncbi:MAG TPA: NUDIX domain-containing protein [Acidothermaceae bacterium]
MSDADQLRLPPSPELVARARAYRESGGSPAPAKASATVILLRDGAQQLEVFMIRRHMGMLFAGGMYVFPGGVVDAADHVGRDHEQAHAFAAIRETFEECGVLLASRANLDPTKLEADRLALIEHRATFDEVLARHGAVAQPQLLRPWSRWITPDFEPRRYDTYFYVAIAPAQDARFVGGEADAAQWVAPEFAVGAQKSGDWLLMPPTEWTLRELSTFTSAADVFAAGNVRDLTPVQVRIDLESEPPRWVVIDT